MVKRLCLVLLGLVGVLQVPAAPASAENAPFTETHGFATKTGHRGVFTWQATLPVTGVVHYGTSPSALTSSVEPTPGSPDFAAMAVADGLEIGETYYWQVEDVTTGTRSEIKSFEAKNAYQDWDGSQYTVDLLVQLDSEALPPDVPHDLALQNIAAGMNVFAERLYDTTDGYARIGEVLITDTNLDYAANIPAEPLVCLPDGNLADVLIQTTVPFDSHTLRGGIDDPCVGFYVGRLGQLVVPWGQATDEDLHFGYVSTHELMHYAFFAPDLYASAPNGGGAECRNPDWDGSLMHNTGGWEGKWVLTELDRSPSLTPCKHGTNGYTWDLMTEKYDDIPAEAKNTIDHMYDTKPRGHEDGGALDIHILDREPGASTLTEYTPEDGNYDCAPGAPLITDEQGDATQYVVETNTLPSEPSLDVVTGDVETRTDREGVTFVIGVDDLTETPPTGATGRHFRYDFTYKNLRFEITATSDLTQGDTFEVGYFNREDPAALFAEQVAVLTGEFDADADEIRVNMPFNAFNEGLEALMPTLTPPQVAPADMVDGSLLEGFTIASQRVVSTPVLSFTPSADLASGACAFVVGDDLPSTGEPIARDDVAATSQNTAVGIHVLANDSDREGDEIHVSAVTDPAHGVSAIGEDGIVTYEPDDNFMGADTFTYTAADTGGRTDTAIVTVTVENACPAAPNGTFFEDVETPDEGWEFDTTANLLLANTPGWAPTDDPFASSPGTSFFTDSSAPDKDDRLVSPPLHLSASSRLVFQHRYSFEPAEAETGRFFDAGVLEVTTNRGDTWQQVPASAFTEGGYNGRVVDTDGYPLRDREAWGGETSRTEMSRVEADLGAFADDDAVLRWRFAADSNAGDIGWFIDDISVSGIVERPTTCNHAPRARADNVQTREDAHGALDVLANDSDPDGDAITLASVDDESANGIALTIDGGKVSYDPAANYNGTDSFSYEISDPSGLTSTATANVTVTPVNDAPVAADDTAATQEDTATTISNLAGNDSDIEGDALTVTSVDATSTRGGTVTRSGGAVTYTPAKNVHGTDGFDYTVSDGNGGTDTGHVTVSVASVNDAPTAVDDAASTKKNQFVTINVLANDTDPEGQTLSLATVDARSFRKGTVTKNPNGTVKYTPPRNFRGTDRFSYTVSDGKGGTDPAVVTVTIR